jgi:hypothetical protein
MRRTKQNLALPPKEGLESREAQATENDERYEAMSGEEATEGVGPAYDEDVPDASREEKAEATADGPLSGEISDPPNTNPLSRKGKRKKRGVKPPNSRSNHPAAHSPKAI